MMKGSSLPSHTRQDVSRFCRLLRRVARIRSVQGLGLKPENVRMHMIDT